MGEGMAAIVVKVLRSRTCSEALEVAVGGDAEAEGLATKGPPGKSAAMAGLKLPKL